MVTVAARGALKNKNSEGNFLLLQGRGCSYSGADPHSLLSLSLSSDHSPHPPHGRSMASRLKSGATGSRKSWGVQTEGLGTGLREAVYGSRPHLPALTACGSHPISTPMPGRPGLRHETRCWKCRANIFGFTDQASLSKLLNFVIAVQKQPQTIK